MEENKEFWEKTTALESILEGQDTFDFSDIEDDFSVLKTEFALQEEILLDEGPSHQGMANVIRYVGMSSL